jgi:signal transduction histidine kinase
MYSAMIALEYFGVLPHRSVFGFGTPPPLTYLGLVLGAFLMLNLVALVCDAVTRAFMKTAQELWDAKVTLERNEKELRRLTSETEFLARAISHELRNPLSAAANAAELMIDEAETSSAEDVRELARLMQYNVTKAYDMLTHLRQLLVAVDKQEELQEVDLGALLRTVVSDVESATRVEHGCVEIPKALPTIQGQPQRLAQVFRNLVLNAIEHGSGTGPAAVLVECVEDTGEPRCFRFSVADHGPGVPLEHRERIFEPFVTLGKRASDGRGLGLTLVRQVVQDAGGRMWVEGAEGQGARFCFTLPRAPD